jgi:hypothetical protein
MNGKLLMCSEEGLITPVTMEYLVNPGIKDYTSSSFKKNRIKERREDQITGVVLHQTGCVLRKENLRILNIKAHYVIHPDGDIWQLHPVTSYLYSANAFNVSTLSIEIIGNFEGDMGKGNLFKPDVFGKSVLQKATILATRRLLGFLTLYSGLPIQYIFAHRQSGFSSVTKRPNRQIDPGEEIWREIGEWGKRALNLSDGGENYTKGGLPIPKNWLQPPLTPDLEIV